MFLEFKVLDQRKNVINPIQGATGVKLLCFQKGLDAVTWI